ncbi:P-loop containing nucleoside triphosphate hydrolase protein [Artomyces pyxidatus]|uniref:P-loop containing nucleoside triphosphate hydrolase protein n=1 Tax=Artomyces pyxidatus TaxID=48021 RepID=A0ACB8TI36_9AGAM|nr:P-loop containing nucleoside triphosphate hydrolase protein [Artomyces pyxidatus]
MDGSSQSVLDLSAASPPCLELVSYNEGRVIWVHPLVIPAYVAAGSAFVFATRYFFSHIRSISETDEPIIESDGAATRAEATSETKTRVQILGGSTIYSFRLTRLLCVLVLLGLSAVTFFTDASKPAEHPFPSGTHDRFHVAKRAWLEFALCLTYLYAALLATLSVTAKPKVALTTTRHLTVLLLATFAVYGYRDIWPLATFTSSPVDQNEDSLLWAKVTILGVTSIVIPLTVPRQYIPYDLKNPAEVPDPSQVASIFSLATYCFLDSIVFLAYRIPHLSIDLLPPLADYDSATNLISKSFKHLDPFSGSPRRHVFWGIMKIYSREYITLGFLVFAKVLATFFGPVGIKGLLGYIESHGEGAALRPWFWIALLFLGPVISTLTMQRYMFITTGLLVQAEAIFTQLVFEHALRIRLIAEVSEGKATSENGDSAIATPHTASVSAADTAVNGGEGPSADNQGAKVPSPLPEDTAGRDAKGSNLIGKINNLVTSDLSNLTEGRDFVYDVVQIPLQTAICVWLLYSYLGWSAFVGMACTVILFPVPGMVAQMSQTVQEQATAQTDARVQIVTETMSVLRMVKMFGWEPKMDERVAKKRAEELKLLKKKQLLWLANNIINYFIPILTMIVTFGTYTAIMKQELRPSTAFSSLAIFTMLSDQFHRIFFAAPRMIQAKISMDRITDFLHNTELLDKYTATDEPVGVRMQNDDNRNVIGFGNASFTWANDDVTTGTMTPSRRRFILRIDDELVFKKGCFNIIIGPTGSGKTSLLMGLLGELHFVPLSVGSWYNLPREGGVAYAAQESWVQNETIKANIVFGAAYDEARYNKVIYQCGLKRDLSLFDAGDNTEVGEKGLTLSGGQKARITLARAVYSSAETILLDDVLAALDVHTARWIVEKCFKGDLLRGRTVLLVTHNVAIASPIADYVVSLGINGTIASRGTVSDALGKDEKLKAMLAEEEREIEEDDKEIDSKDPDTEIQPKRDGKLIVAEEVELGHVTWDSMKLFLSSLANPYGIPFWLTFFGGLLLCDIAMSLQTWWMGHWAEQYDIVASPSQVHISFYLGIYVAILIFSLVVYATGCTAYVYGSLRASTAIHRKLVRSILGTNLRWLDTTPTSRVIARCTQDIHAVDTDVAESFLDVATLFINMAIKLVAIVILTPIFLLPGVLLAVMGIWCARVYMKAQISVKREMSNAKAPVLGNFGAAIAGLTSIRAYGAQLAFRQESHVRLERYVRASRAFYNLNRQAYALRFRLAVLWVNFRIEILGAVFSAALAAYMVYVPGSSNSSSNIGFSLNMAVTFSGAILWWVIVLNDFEVHGNSLERIKAYIDIEQEPKASKEGIPPAYWPASGDLRVDNLSARYSTEGPDVLHNLSFHINSGERVGIVGRTGSGKSSLALALLRCILTEGNVYYDGLPMRSVNLDSLRSNITIIPQMPELLSGSLRENLDPFGQYDDATLNSALRAAGFFSLQDNSDENQFTLDSGISGGGGNLSVGQRQIVALARAIVRGSKLLILDEATSAIDYQTDAIIQSSLRHELKDDVTLLTIAHRLQTIMDADKVMVLDAGNIVEFDKPSELLKKKEGLFRSLVEESNDKDALYALVRK